MKFLIVVFICICASSAVKNRFNSRFQRQEQVPHTIYGPPPQEYGPPPTSAAPVLTTEEAAAATTPEIPGTTEAESELVNGTARLTKGANKGLYYIYQPNGQLQKVLYSTRQDPRTKTVTAQLKYEDVQPIRGPIFAVDPETGALRRYQEQ